MRQFDIQQLVRRNNSRRETFARLIFAGLIGVATISAVFVEPARAQSSVRIAAIVNDEIISGFDLDTRLRLVMLSSRLPDRPEVRKRFRPQILRNLVDERLRMQEAKRIGITVKPDAISRAVADLERRNNMPAGAMGKLLEQNGLDRQTLENRLEAEIAWGRVIRRRVRAGADIGVQEVETEIARIETDKGKTEYLISEIFLQPTRDQSTEQIREFAKRIGQQVRSGASFSALASTFSLSASASVGGDLGWVRPDQLDPAINLALNLLKTGDISEPIPGSEGVYVIQLRNRRLSPGLGAQRTRMTLRNYLQTIKPNSPDQEVQQISGSIQTALAAARSCADFDRIGGSLQGGKAGRLNNVLLSSLASNMRDAVRALPLGKSSQPIRIGNNLLVLMVCRRNIENTKEEVQKRVEGILRERRAELVSRRIIRNLRRKSFVDIRS